LGGQYPNILLNNTSWKYGIMDLAGVILNQMVLLRIYVDQVTGQQLSISLIFRKKKS
jgi:hypothetical protein